jgi:hypothetical protein
VYDFAAAYMRQFLLQDVGLLPDLDSFVRKVTFSSTIIDFFSKDELEREFFIFSGLDSSVFDEVGMEFPDDFTVEIDTGSEDGLLMWLQDNVDEVCGEEGADELWVMEKGGRGYIVVLNGIGASINDIVKQLEERGIEVNKSSAYRFERGSAPRAGDEKWVYLLSVVKVWGSKEVEVIKLNDINECMVTMKVGDLLRELNEGVSLEALYRGAELYRVKQPGVQRRVDAGEYLQHSHVMQVKFQAFWGVRELRIEAKVKSESGDGNEYWVVIIVEDMDFSREFDPWTPVKVLDAKTHEEFYMRLIDPSDEVRLYCTCKDFQCRFAAVLKSMKALQGRVTCPRRMTQRKSQNVGRVPSACKHIFSILGLLIKNKVIISRVSQRASEIDITSGLWA